MRRIILIVSVVLSLIVLGAVLIIFARSRSVPAAPAGQFGTLPPPSPVSYATSSNNIPTGNTIQFQTSQGVVETSNFYNTAEQKWDFGSMRLKHTARYEIQYLQGNSTFLIVSNATTKSDFSQLRPQFEADFLHIVGVSKQDACKLTVTVRTVKSYNPELDGINFGLSFCPGSVL